MCSELTSSICRLCAGTDPGGCSQQPDTRHSRRHGALGLPKSPSALAVTAAGVTQPPARAAVPRPGPSPHTGRCRAGPRLFHFTIFGAGDVGKFESDVTNLASPRLGSPARLETTALSPAAGSCARALRAAVPQGTDPAPPGVLPASPCPGGCCQGQHSPG